MSFTSRQRRTARKLGYGDDVDAMNRDHDPLHAELCEWLGIPSFALQQAAGARLNDGDQILANYEEDAVLAVQRLRRMHRNRYG